MSKAEKEKIENKEELLKKISKEQYGNEWYIETAILAYKSQEENTYTFFRDEEEELLRKYNWCQRPCNSNMSLKRFTKNGEVEGYMSESVAEYHGLVQVDLNEFIHRFIKPIIKENLQLKENRQKLKEVVAELQKDGYESYAQEILEIIGGENE